MNSFAISYKGLKTSNNTIYVNNQSDYFKNL